MGYYEKIGEIDERLKVLEDSAVADIGALETKTAQIATNGQSFTMTGNGVAANVKADNETRLANLEANSISGMANKNYKIIGCVLRNTGDGWTLITGGGHTPVNIQDLINIAATTTLNFVEPFGNVVSLIVSPDETLVKLGYNFGASVGLGSATIHAAQMGRKVGGYIFYNGSAWQIHSSSKEVSEVSFLSGILTVTHGSIADLFVSAFVREGIYNITPGSLGATTTTLYIKDSSGNLVTTADTNMKIYFERSQAAGAVNMVDIVSESGNIWVFGIMEEL